MAIFRYLVTHFRQRTRITLAEPAHTVVTTIHFFPEPALASKQTLRLLPVAEYRDSFHGTL